MRARSLHTSLVARSLLATLWLGMLGCIASAAEPEEGPPLLPPPGLGPVIPQPLPEVIEGPEADPPTPTAEQPGEAPNEPTETVAIEETLPPPRWYEPAYWFCDCWDAGIEFGLNGTTGGPNETVNHRAGGHLRRKTKAWKFNSNISYNRNYANKVETQNNAQQDARVNRMFGESPWSLFVSEQLQYDEFQAFDLRLSLNTGIGYEFFETENFDLSGRVGAGASHEFGGPDESVPAEAMFGLETEYRISCSQRLRGKVDYFPEWANFEQYRVVTDAGWEIDLDKPANVSLKFSVTDRYDSTPNGVNPNQLDYAVLLIWGL